CSLSRLRVPSATFPLNFGVPNPENGGVLLVVDAACFVDPFIRDGISLALRSGNIAARSLQGFLRGQASFEDVIQRYREAYQLQLMPIFRTSSEIRVLFGFLKPVRDGLIHLFGRRPALALYLA